MLAGTLQERLTEPFPPLAVSPSGAVDPLDRQQAAERVGLLAVRRVAAPRPGFAVAGDQAVDEAVVVGGEVLVAEAEALHVLRPAADHHRVGPLDRRLHDFGPVRRALADREAADRTS